MPAPGKLSAYRARRDFTKTTEPAGAAAVDAGHRFVVHKHSATADHYDLRLEHNGVLLSWAVPRGPSLNPKDKRYAVQTEDHPLQYLDFEDVIPKGEYGGGPMIVWDTGTWAPMGDADEGLRKGDFKFRLWGQKLKGGWMLVRMKPKPGDRKQNWLLFKENDPEADPSTDILAARPESVKTGRRIEELVAAPKPAPARTKSRPVKLEPGRLEGAKAAPLPRTIAPQLATAADEPPRGAGWIHEIKFDGYRTLALIRDGKCRLITRGGLDWTGKYGDLGPAFGTLNCKEAAIDGEICAPDASGHTTFGAPQQALSENAGYRLVFYAFDLMHLDGWDLRKVPLAKRKALLQRLCGGEAKPPAGILVSDHVEGEGQPLYDKVSEMGLEGIVSKRADSAYVEGRSKTWIKVKAKLARDFVIVGYTPSAAAGGLGALALGEWVDGDLHYRGKVGTGFDQQTLKMLLKRLQPLRDGGVPLEGLGTKDVVWIRPVLAASVHYSNLTSDGSIRHGVYHGLREPEVTAAPEAAPRKRFISDADLANIWVTNPTRRMFGKSGPTKLDIAVYYAAVGDYMLPHILHRPVSLVRCPNARPEDCFFQRHAFNGMPASVDSFPVEMSEGVRRYISIEDAKGYVALAQFGVVEFHAWGCTRDEIEKPDRVTFDLDPGEGMHWREVVMAALHVREQLQKRFKLVPFVKTTGGKGLHIVVPIAAREWKEVHKTTGDIAAAIAGADPDTFTTNMGKTHRTRRIFIDIHRNARTATAVSPYSLRARTNLPASAPVGWADLPALDDPADFNYSSLPSFLTKTGDPWADINEFARDLAPLSKTGS